MRPAVPALGAALALILSAGGCATARPAPYVDAAAPPSPARTWSPPQGAVPPPPPAAREAPTLPPELLAGPHTVTLAEAVDLALADSPATRRSWRQARSAAADVGSKEGALWPQLEVDAQLLRQKSVALGGRFETLLTSWGPSATLSWTLFDFGGRKAEVEQARQTLFSAGFLHDAAVSDLVLQVEGAYYQYQGAKELVVSTEASLKQAEENLTAAEERRRAGVATIADVLQAKTSVSQRRLEVETARGLIETTRGALATALGVPATIPVDVTALPDGLRLEGATPAVEELIARAESERPDLAAARARARGAWSKVRSARASGLPALLTVATAGRTYFESADATTPFGDSWSAGLFLRWPLFSGFSKAYDVKKAEEDAAAADAFTDSLAQQAVLQVWTGYYAVRTAAQRIRAARDLLESAGQSEEVARGRYKAGVGGILDLLAAESSLAEARATDVQARASFLTALAQLAHDIGVLGLPTIPQLKKEAP